MYAFIHQYFATHQLVLLPGLGSLQVLHQCAYLDDNGNLHAPTQKIVFTNQKTELANKNLYQFLASALQVEEIVAIKKFHEFIYECKDIIAKEHCLTFPSLGTFTKDENQNIVFTQADNTFINYQPIQLSDTSIKIIQSSHTNNNVTITSKTKADYWWIYALILFAIAMVAIILKWQQQF